MKPKQTNQQTSNYTRIMFLVSFSRRVCRLPRTFERCFNAPSLAAIQTAPGEKRIRGLTFEEHLNAPTFQNKNPYLSEENIRNCYEWTPRDTDIFGCANMKSGTTWLSYVCHQLTTRGQREPRRYLDDEIGILGAACNFRDGDVGSLSQGFGNCEETWPWGETPRRVYLNHLPYPCSPYKGNAKYIVIVRDGRDMALSLHYFYNQMIPSFRREVAPTSAESIDKFLGREWGSHGDWFYHVYDWYQASKENPDKILLLLYEDMKKHTRETIDKIGRHIGIQLSEEEMKGVLKHVGYKRMKAQEHKFSHGHLMDGKGGHIFLPVDKTVFFRKGVCGYWQDEWTEEQNEIFMQMFYEVFGDDHPWKNSPYNPYY